MKRHALALRLAQELSKQLHEVMGWDGPMTHPQALAWEMWLLGDPQDKIEQGKWMAERQVEAAKVGSTVVVVKRSEMTKDTAADLLRAGASRKQKPRIN